MTSERHITLLAQDKLYQRTLDLMTKTIWQLEKLVPPPKMIELPFGEAFRYVEQTPQQALILKLARVITGLRSVRILLEHGMFQEQAAIQRILDELHEDIQLLSYGLIYSDFTELHQNYLDAFFKEEFDKPTAIESTQKRPMICREKIQDYLAKIEGQALDPAHGKELSKTIHKTYSGFVHAAAIHVMDLYGGHPPRFYVIGMHGTPREEEYRHDAWNYFYRGILVFALVSAAFEDMQRFESIRAYADAFAQESGRPVR